MMASTAVLADLTLIPVDQSEGEPLHCTKDSMVEMESAKERNGIVDLSGSGNVMTKLQTRDPGVQTPKQDILCERCFKQTESYPNRQCVKCGVTVEPNKYQKEVDLAYTYTESWSCLPNEVEAKLGSNSPVAFQELAEAGGDIGNVVLLEHTEIVQQFELGRTDVEMISLLKKPAAILQNMAHGIEVMVTTLRQKVNEFELQLQASCASTQDGTIVLPIPKFSEKRQEAIDNKITAIYSPPFYTGRNGYKMCIRADLNGYGEGRGTHISLFCVIMKGGYDNLLKWPFESKISLLIVDQTRRRHIFKKESMSFQKPERDKSVAIGFPTFARLEAVTKEDYAKDDIVFIQCIVDTTNIIHP